MEDSIELSKPDIKGAMQKLFASNGWGETYIEHIFDDQLSIHFGNIENEKVKGYHELIHEHLNNSDIHGWASIITTQGVKYSLLTLTITICELDEDEEIFLDISYL